jgi:hypothetical protein
MAVEVVVAADVVATWTARTTRSCQSTRRRRVAVEVEAAGVEDLKEQRVVVVEVADQVEGVEAVPIVGRGGVTRIRKASWMMMTTMRRAMRTMERTRGISQARMTSRVVLMSLK